MSHTSQTEGDCDKCKTDSNKGWTACGMSNTAPRPEGFALMVASVRGSCPPLKTSALYQRRDRTRSSVPSAPPFTDQKVVFRECSLYVRSP